MEKPSKGIGSIFEEGLKNYSPVVENEEWLLTEMAVTRNNFFKFSPTRFNICYSLVILATCVISSLVFVDHFFIMSRDGILAKTAIEQTTTTNETVQQEPSAHQSPEQINPPEEPKKTAPVQASLLGNNNNNKEIKSAALSTTATTSAKDSLPLVANKLPMDTAKIAQPIIDSVATKKKPKKVVYITRQDTVRIVDTVNHKLNTSKRTKTK